MMPKRQGTISIAVVALSLASAWPATGQAAQPHCMGLMLSDVAAEEAPEQIKSKDNKVFGPVTRIKVSRSNGRMSYCVGDSYCYRANAFQLTTCRIKRDLTLTTAEFFVYSAR